MLNNKFWDHIQFYTNKIEEKLNINFSIFILVLIVAQHSFLIKFSGIFILILFNWRAILNIRFKEIPPFYTLIPLIEVFKFFLLDPNFSNGHIAQFLVGLVYWLASIICFYVIFRNVTPDKSKKTENTLVYFVISNFVFSFAQLVNICIIEGVINPYNTGHGLPYGISTGDLIKGYLNGLQISNAFISILLTLYFAHRKKMGIMLLALIPFLLTGSNYVTIVFLMSLGLYFLLNNDRKYAFSILIINTIITVLFYVFITPLNGIYTYEKIASIIINKPISSEVKHSNEYTSQLKEQYQKDISNNSIKEQKQLAYYDLTNTSGKSIAYKQTFSLLKENPKYLLFGTGMGGFSSNIAFNFSGVVDNSAMSRLFPQYETQHFANNHKKVYEQMKSMNMIFHSESNKPFSLYNQLLGEYGLIGLGLFVFYYIIFYFKKLKITAYTAAMVLILLFASNLYYYIELLNLFLFFEIIMALALIEKKEKINV